MNLPSSTRDYDGISFPVIVTSKNIFGVIREQIHSTYFLPYRTGTQSTRPMRQATFDYAKRPAIGVITMRFDPGERWYPEKPHPLFLGICLYGNNRLSFSCLRLQAGHCGILNALVIFLTVSPKPFDFSFSLILKIRCKCISVCSFWERN